MYGNYETVELKLSRFHKAFDPKDPLDIEDLIHLRDTLVKEEALEVAEAFEDLESAIVASKVWKDDPKVQMVLKARKAALLKELCDLVYVAVGTAVAMGMPFDVAFNRVHASNMSKLGPDGKPIYREDGKVIKPDTYVPANLEDLV